MNLENLNLVELNAQEVETTEGGIHPAFWVALAWSAWENVGDIRAGYAAGTSAFYNQVIALIIKLLDKS